MYDKPQSWTALIRPSIELLLAECILFSLVWLWHDYIAKFLTLLIPMICAGVLIVSLIAEFLDRSKVSRFYYLAMGISVLSPILVALFMILSGFATWSFDQSLLK